MPGARFTVADRALQSLLVFSDADLRRIVAVIESIAANPRAAAQHSATTRQGRLIHICQTREVDIFYTFNAAATHVWVLELRHSDR
jgi:plasmid stabilization system protein ParE